MKLKKVSPDLSVRYREFPDMRFGQAGGRVYFDATHYVRKKEIAGGMDIFSGFSRHFRWWIDHLSGAYAIPPEEVMVKDADTGHIFFEESLDLLFIAYVEPAFSVYALDRVSEMLVNGVALSDTALVLSVRDRFAREDILKFYGGNEEEQV